MLDEDLLRDYCEGFFGYGNPHGKYWFFGPEEAGGRCEEEVQERLELWKQHPEPRQIIDGFKFDRKRVHSRRPFDNPQTTWDRLIRVQLAAEGQRDEIGSFKLQKWTRKPAKSGDPSAQNCLLELLPLPCPNMKSWPYEEWTQHPHFQNRQRYRKAFLVNRRNRLLQHVTEYEPAVVVFYGRSCRSQWSKIAGFRWRDVVEEPFGENNQACVQFRSARGTLFVLTHHPSPYRSKLRSDEYDAYFTWVGEQIGERLRRRSGE